MDVEKIGQSQWFQSMWDGLWQGAGWTIGAGLVVLAWRSMKRGDDEDEETDFYAEIDD